MMHGRYNRHMQDFWQTATSKGSLECKRADATVDPRGCRAKNIMCPNTSRTCEDAHTLAWWLKNGHNAPGNGYRAFAFAKTENMNPGDGGFHTLSSTGRSLGAVRCNGDPPCVAALQFNDFANPDLQQIPIPQFFNDRRRGLRAIVDAIDEATEVPGGETIIQRYAPTEDRWFQKYPFFMWFGPHIPHGGAGAEDLFNDAYESTAAQDEFAHLKRVTWLDTVIGGLIYHLRRACTCNAAGELHSLYENTVFLFLTDQGFLQAGAKFDTTENTHRTPLIVSAPDYRKWMPNFPPTRVLDDELAHAVDLLPTILGYAGMTYWPNNTPEEEYAISRNLKTLIDNPQSARRRHLVFGEMAEKRGGNTGEHGGQKRYVVNRPGRLGVCEFPFSASGASHVHPCLANEDCPQGTGNCVCPPSATNCTGTATINPTKWKRCANKPSSRCITDSDCVAGLCNTPTCKDDPSIGSFKDFKDTACSAGNELPCVPAGVCRPLVLRVETKPGPNVSAATGIAGVYDLDWQPDHVDTDLVNLRKRLPGYLPSGNEDRLGGQIWKCVQDFAHLDPTSLRWTTDGGCPAVLEDLKP